MLSFALFEQGVRADKLQNRNKAVLEKFEKKFSNTAFGKENAVLQGKEDALNQREFSEPGIMLFEIGYSTADCKSHQR